MSSGGSSGASESDAVGYIVQAKAGISLYMVYGLQVGDRFKSFGRRTLHRTGPGKSGSAAGG